MINIFINSEKYCINLSNNLTYELILNLSGYPISDNYEIVDEKLNRRYSKNSIIEPYNNMSLVIYVK